MPSTLDVDAARRWSLPGFWLIGLGGLFAGVTGPLLSAFLPPLVRQALGDRPALIGLVMAIDNLLLLLLVPWAGALSDRAAARGRGRLPLVLAALVMTAAAMALFPASPAFGIGGVIGVMVVLYTGINLQRSPFQALIADLVPARERSMATGSVTFQMCVAAIVFLMLGRVLGMQPAFLAGAATVLLIAAAFKVGLRESRRPAGPAADVTPRTLVAAAAAAFRGDLPGVRAIFVASFLLQLTFQTFTTWYTLHATERFHARPEDATAGFIAWALGGVVGAWPAGMVGTRFGRRGAMLGGFLAMTVLLLLLHRVADQRLSVVLLLLASASWAFPTVNAYPLFVEPVRPADRGTLSALFLICMALGGVVGDPLNGVVFSLAGSYRSMFVLMAAYTALAFIAIRRIRWT